MIPGTTANSILEAIGSQVKPANRFQDSRKDPERRYKSRLLGLCALPDITTLVENPTWYARLSKDRGMFKLRELTSGEEVYLSLGIGEGIPFSKGVPPIDLNPYISLKEEERLLLLEGVLKVIYEYELDPDEKREILNMPSAHYKPYYEILTEFLLQVPRDSQKDLGKYMKKYDTRRPTGKFLAKTAELFTQAMEFGRRFVERKAKAFLESLPSGSSSRNLLEEFFARIGLIDQEIRSRGPGRKPPISEEGRKKIIDVAMYLTVFYATMTEGMKLRKTTMGKILKAFAEKYSDYLGVTGELGDTFINRVLAEARNKRFRRICLIINPRIEYAERDEKETEKGLYPSNLVVVELQGTYHRMGFSSTYTLRQLLHKQFGSTMFVYEEGTRRGARVDFNMLYASAALTTAIPREERPPTLKDVKFFVENDNRIASVVGAGGVKIYYNELTPESRLSFVNRLAEEFLPKNELYEMTKSFMKEYLEKNVIEEEEEERSPAGSRIASEALFF